jgi:hypothetical protein
MFPPSYYALFCSLSPILCVLPAPFAPYLFHLSPIFISSRLVLSPFPFIIRGLQLPPLLSSVLRRNRLPLRLPSTSLRFRAIGPTSSHARPRSLSLPPHPVFRCSSSLGLFAVVVAVFLLCVALCRAVGEHPMTGAGGARTLGLGR